MKSESEKGCEMNSQLGHDIVVFRPANYFEDRYKLDEHEIEKLSFKKS